MEAIPKRYPDGKRNSMEGESVSVRNERPLIRLPAPWWWLRDGIWAKKKNGPNTRDKLHTHVQLLIDTRQKRRSRNYVLPCVFEAASFFLYVKKIERRGGGGEKSFEERGKMHCSLVAALIGTALGDEYSWPRLYYFYSWARTLMNIRTGCGSVKF